MKKMMWLLMTFAIVTVSIQARSAPAEAECKAFIDRVLTAPDKDPARKDPGRTRLAARAYAYARNLLGADSQDPLNIRHDKSTDLFFARYKSTADAAEVHVILDANEDLRHFKITGAKTTDYRCLDPRRPAGSPATPKAGGR